MTTSRYPCSCKQFATIYRNIFKLQINNRYFTLITVIKISLIFISKQENLKRLIKKMNTVIITYKTIKKNEVKNNYINFNNRYYYSYNYKKN